MISDMSLQTTVLVVDDEIRSQEALRRTLEEDFRVLTASSAMQAREILENESVQIILSDQRMPEISGVKFLKEVRVRWPDTIRIIISGYTDSEDIIAGINEAGIYQYLLKPWHPEQLLLTLKTATELYQLQKENHRLAQELRMAAPELRRQVEDVRHQVHAAFGFENIVRHPESPMQQICDYVQRAARFDVTVLLSGESGTGKELLARAVHYASARAHHTFIVANCGALPDNLLESELFGHKKGAYTGAVENRVGLFQQAHGGTIFLDEIGETSPAFQVKLLRVLQEGEIRPLGSNQTLSVDVRIVAATNRDLEAEIKKGNFREDLYYRLATVPVRVPPLRERIMDIPLLIKCILKNANKNLGRGICDVDQAVIEKLSAYTWPGNIRELQNEIHRMLVISDRASLTQEVLSPHICQLVLAQKLSDESQDGLLRGKVGALEVRLLQETLSRHDGNISRTARELGLSRVGLRNKLLRLGIMPPARESGRPVVKERMDG
jgi:two-component system, NtrC family, response regulator HupR/HoxA